MNTDETRRTDRKQTVYIVCVCEETGTFTPPTLLTVEQIGSNVSLEVVGKASGQAMPSPSYVGELLPTSGGV